jgi:hypothetical protein
MHIELKEWKGPISLHPRRLQQVQHRKEGSVETLSGPIRLGTIRGWKSKLDIQTLTKFAHPVCRQAGITVTNDSHRQSCPREDMLVQDVNKLLACH